MTNNELGISNIDAKTLIAAYEDALAEEISAWYAYTIVAPFLQGPNHLEIEEEYQDHAKDEFEDHAMWLMERINQLGGSPVHMLAPWEMQRVASHKYIRPIPPYDVIKSLDQNIQAEKDAIETYMKLEKLTRDTDISANNKMKAILADEQEHLQDLIEWKDACQNGQPIKRKLGGRLNYGDFFKK